MKADLDEFSAGLSSILERYSKMFEEINAMDAQQQKELIRREMRLITDQLQLATPVVRAALMRMCIPIGDLMKAASQEMKALSG